MDYYIMSGDEPVAVWKNYRLKILNEQLVPLYLENIGDFYSWLSNRGMLLERVHGRMLRNAMGAEFRNPMGCALMANAAKITDNYWIKEIGSSLEYKDVRPTDDRFASLALKGKYGKPEEGVIYTGIRSPEYTNTGHTAKCWKWKDNQWWMYKMLDANERAGELIAVGIGKAMGFSVVECSRSSNCIKYKDFTDNASVNFEPAIGIIGEGWSYIEVVEWLRDNHPHLVKGYMDMLILDAIMHNSRRSVTNYGFLRDRKDGHIISFAPIFNNKNSFTVPDCPERYSRSGDLMIARVNELFEYDRSLRGYIPQMLEKDFVEVFDNLRLRVKKSIALPYVINGYIRLLMGKNIGFFCSNCD